jgi:hypothetical protein
VNKPAARIDDLFAYMTSMLGDKWHAFFYTFFAEVAARFTAENAVMWVDKIDQAVENFMKTHG